MEIKMRRTSSGTKSSNRRRFTRQRGSMMLYAIVGMTVVMAFLSLSIDYGRAQVAKSELQRAADAAALAAAGGIKDDTTFTRASSAITDNTSEGAAVLLKKNDVIVGTWASGTF